MQDACNGVLQAQHAAVDGAASAARPAERVPLLVVDSVGCRACASSPLLKPLRAVSTLL